MDAINNRSVNDRVCRGLINEKWAHYSIKRRGRHETLVLVTKHTQVALQYDVLSICSCCDLGHLLLHTSTQLGSDEAVITSIECLD